MYVIGKRLGGQINLQVREMRKGGIAIEDYELYLSISDLSSSIVLVL